MHWFLILKLFGRDNNTISYGNPVTLTFETTGCKDTEQEVQYLEHVEVRTTIHYSIRGVLEIYLTSPAGNSFKYWEKLFVLIFVLGTQVQILNRRKLDDSKKGFKDWTFMSVTTWGELAQGMWTVTIIDNVKMDLLYLRLIYI